MSLETNMFHQLAKLFTVG